MDGVVVVVLQRRDKGAILVSGELERQLLDGFSLLCSAMTKIDEKNIRGSESDCRAGHLLVGQGHCQRSLGSGRQAWRGLRLGCLFYIEKTIAARQASVPSQSAGSSMIGGIVMMATYKLLHESLALAVDQLIDEVAAIRGGAVAGTYAAKSSGQRLWNVVIGLSIGIKRMYKWRRRILAQHHLRILGDELDQIPIVVGRTMID